MPCPPSDGGEGQQIGNRLYSQTAKTFRYLFTDTMKRSNRFSHFSKKHRPFSPGLYRQPEQKPREHGDEKTAAYGKGYKNGTGSGENRVVGDKALAEKCFPHLLEKG